MNLFGKKCEQFTEKNENGFQTKVIITTKDETVFHLADWQRLESLEICHDDRGIQKQKLTLLVENVS